MVSVLNKIGIDAGPPTLLELSKSSTLQTHHLTLMDILRIEIDRQRLSNPFLQRSKTICYPPRRVARGAMPRSNTFMGRERPSKKKKKKDSEEKEEFGKNLKMQFQKAGQFVSVVSGWEWFVSTLMMMEKNTSGTAYSLQAAQFIHKFLAEKGIQLDVSQH